MHRVALVRHQLPERAQVGLHAVEVEDARAVVPAAGHHARARAVHVQRRHDLALRCGRRGAAPLSAPGSLCCSVCRAAPPTWGVVTGKSSRPV